MRVGARGANVGPAEYGGGLEQVERTVAIGTRRLSLILEEHGEFVEEGLTTSDDLLPLLSVGLQRRTSKGVASRS